MGGAPDRALRSVHCVSGCSIWARWFSQRVLEVFSSRRYSSRGGRSPKNVDWRRTMKFTAALIFSAVSLSAADLSLPSSNLVAHEWGTFTSVAGVHGAPVAWAPLNGPADL